MKNLTDKQRTEICDNIGRLLASELESKKVRNKVERAVTDYLKGKRVNIDASDIIKGLGWSVIVRLKGKPEPNQDNFLEAAALADDKKKGDFTVLQRKKKQEIIEENQHQVNIPPDVSEEEKKALAQTGDDATSGW